MTSLSDNEGDFKLVDFSQEDLQTFIIALNATQFLGFDPKVIRKKFQEEAKGNWKKDLLTIFAIYSNKGTKLVDKKLKRTSEEGRLIIERLSHTYGLKKDITTRAEDLKADDITIQRLISAYAHIYSYVLASTPDQHLRVFGAQIPFPNYLKFPQSISLIPHDRMDLIEGYKTWSAYFNQIINSNIAAKDPVRDNIRREQYMRVMHDSQLYSEDFRKAHLLACSQRRELISPSIPLISGSAPPSSTSGISSTFPSTSTTVAKKPSVPQDPPK